MYFFILIVVNLVMCFVGFWVNGFSLLQIFGDPGGFWGGGGREQILIGVVLILISCTISVGVNCGMYFLLQRKSQRQLWKLLLPIAVWILVTIVVPYVQIYGTPL